MKEVLVVTHSGDATIDYLIEEYKDVNFFRLNTDLIERYSIHISEEKIEIVNNITQKKIINTDCESVYFRRMMLPEFKEYNQIYFQALVSDFLSNIEGIIDVFAKKVLTTPTILKRADNKVIQTQLAKKFGFKMPCTLITNNNKAVERFFEIEDKIIVKPLSVGRLIMENSIEIVQTNLVDKKLELPSLAKNPTYFQQYIGKEYELRITIINSSIYSVKIYSEDQVDWRRFNNNVKYELTQVPETLAQRCLAIMDELNIKYAAFDFIYDGLDYYFLELNANGQWLWLEKELGLDISKKIIEYLKGED